MPAREFVSGLDDQYQSKDRESWLFPAEYLASLQYNPDHKARQSSDNPAQPTAEKTPLRAASGFGMTAQSEQLQRIGDLKGVAETEPSGQMETVVANIWRKVPGRPGIGLNVNFFEAGSTSLKAVQVIGMIGKELKQNLPIISLFECPTVRLLAARLNAAAGSPSSEPSTARATLRGQQRRSRAVRRTRSQ